jgi:hypothetical protein
MAGNASTISAVDLTGGDITIGAGKGLNAGLPGNLYLRTSDASTYLKDRATETNGLYYNSTTGLVSWGSMISQPSFTITGNDALSLTGDATVWDDLMFPFNTGHQGNATYPPFNADSLYFSFGVDSAGVDAQFMYFVIQMPHKMKIGSTIYPHVHYKQEDATTDTPIFIMKYKWYDLNGTTQKGWKWKKMATATGTTNKTHQLVYNTGGISGSGITQVSSILICQVYLYAPAAGNSTCNAYQFDLHYEVDALGSRTQLAK